MLCECNQIENEYHGLYSIFLGSIVPYLAQTNDFPSLTPAVPKPEAVQNPVQYLHAEGRMAKQPQNRKNHNLPVCNNMRNGTEPCDENHLYEMAPVVQLQMRSKALQPAVRFPRLSWMIPS